jgi:hypothetical protein
MAQRWSINEDIIICQYCMENQWAYSSDYDIEMMTASLVESGYAPRSIGAIRKRAYYYQTMCIRWELSYIPNQVVMIYDTLFGENAQRRQEIKSCIDKFYHPDVPKECVDANNPLLVLTGDSSGLLGYQHTIDFASTFPMVLQKYVELKGIKKHNVMCKRIGMKPDTFSAILRGKYNDVKKDNVLRICVGLELSVVEAEELLNSAGFMLSNAVMTDVVIKASLWNRIYNAVVINAELYENHAPMLFNVDNI